MKQGSGTAPLLTEISGRGVPIGVREQPLKAATNSAVALAGGAFPPSTVRHRDHTPTLSDEACFLKRSGDAADGGALHAQHVGQEPMGKQHPEVWLLSRLSGRSSGSPSKSPALLPNA